MPNREFFGPWFFDSMAYSLSPDPKPNVLHVDMQTKKGGAMADSAPERAWLDCDTTSTEPTMQGETLP